MDAHKSGETTGPAGKQGLLGQVAGTESASKGTSQRRWFWPDIELKGPDWSTWLRGLWVELKELDEFNFTALLHTEIETPVSYDKAHDTADITLTFSWVTASGAYCCGFSHSLKRGCGRYLYEPRDLVFTSSVAHPVQNIGPQGNAGNLHSQWNLRVTWC